MNVRWLLVPLLWAALLLCAEPGWSQDAGTDVPATAAAWQQQADQYRQQLQDAQKEMEQLRAAEAGARQQLEQLQQQLQQHQQQSAASSLDAQQAVADAVAQKEKELHVKLASLQQQVDMLQHAKQQQVQAALTEQEQALTASCDAKQAVVQERIRTLQSELEASRKGSDSCSTSLASLKQELAQAKQQESQRQQLPPWLAAALNWLRQWEPQARHAREQLPQKLAPLLAAAQAKAQEVQAAVLPLLAKARGAVQDAIARLGLTELIGKASATLSDLTGQTARQLRRTERELKHIISAHLQSSPSLKAYEDPVLVQLLAYMVLGSPLLLLLPLLAALRGGKQQKQVPAQGRRRTKGDARGDSTPVRARQGPRGGGQANGRTPGGARGGRVLRDGNDSIYTP